MENFFSNLIKHKNAALITILIISTIAALLSLTVNFDNSLEIWFLENDPNLNTYKDYVKRFEADQFTLVVINTDDIFTPEHLKIIDEITSLSKDAKNAHNVRSITNVKTFKSIDNSIIIDKLIEKLPSTLEEAAIIKKEVINNPLFTGTLISKDGKTAAILVELKPGRDDSEGKIEMADSLEAIIDKFKNKDISIRLAGTPPVDKAFYLYSKQDMELLVPITILVMVIATFLVYKSFFMSLVPLSIVLLSLLWTFGLMGAIGLKLNVTSSIIIALVLAIGVADSIHVLSEYYRWIGKGKSKIQSVVKSMNHLILPCFFTSTTTIAGLLSLTITNLRPIREFALTAAFGVAVAFVLSFTFIPALLIYLPKPKAKNILKIKEGPIQRLIVLISRPKSSLSKLIVTFSIVFLLISIWGVSKLVIGVNTMNFFKDDAPVKQDIIEVDKALGGSTSIEILITTKEDQLKEPITLNNIDKLQRWIESINGVTRTLSIVDTLKELNRIMNDGNHDFYKVPETRELAAQYYLLMEGEDEFDNAVQDDYSVTRISARVNMSAADELTRAVPKLEQRLESEFEKTGIKGELTGFVKLMFNMEQYIIDSQIFSLLIAFTVIMIMMILMLQSVKLGMFSMIPNFLPIIMGIAFMAFTKINLDSGTVMIGSIVLGLVVDDTVHFLIRFKNNIKKGSTIENSISTAMDETARPIILTSIVLSAAFSIMLFGNFAPNIHFGGVSAVVIIIAVIADLILLPAALILVRPNFSHTKST